MTKERDTAHKIVAEINGYTIIRSEARNFDTWEQTYSGHTKVYYDVCDRDMDVLESFKSLKDAKRFCIA